MTFATQLDGVLRRVDLDGTGDATALTQTFAASVDDLWSACTDPRRLARWFELVEAELRLGGRYRMADSGTVGTVETCDAPNALSITWEHGDDSSRVTVTVDTAAADDATDPGSATLTARHDGDDDENWREHGPAAGGRGWDAAFLGLAMLLDDPTTSADDVLLRMTSPEGARFVEDIAARWSTAHQAAGASSSEADADGARAIVVEREQWGVAE